MSFFMPLSLPAQTLKTSVPASSGGNRTRVTQPPSSTHREVTGNIRMESMQYLSSVKEAPELTSSQLLSARLSVMGSPETASWLEYGGDFSGGTFFRRTQTQFAVHEAYLTSRFSPNSTLSMGRKKADWSELDSRWKLGLWQPHFAIDSLRPEEQGLTGFFLDLRSDNFELMGFATPIYIPTMGPDIHEEDGNLVSGSRWYRQPSSQYEFNNRINSIKYSLDIPETSKLVGNPGSAVMSRLGRKDEGPWIAGAWGFKPVNELLLKRQVVKIINQDRFDVTVSPDVTYHEIASVDAGYSTEVVKASFSYLQDKPREKRPDKDWSMQKLQPLQAVSAQCDVLVRNVFSRSIQLQLGYLKVTGGGIVDITADGKADDFTLFDQRMKFTDATSVSVQGELMKIARRPLVSKIRYLYDRDQRGTLVNTEFLYYPRNEWALVMGTDVLGVEDEKFNPSGFLNQFRANDRVYGGMTYVF